MLFAHAPAGRERGGMLPVASLPTSFSMLHTKILSLNFVFCGDTYLFDVRRRLSYSYDILHRLLLWIQILLGAKWISYFPRQTLTAYVLRKSSACNHGGVIELEEFLPRVERMEQMK